MTYNASSTGSPMLLPYLGQRTIKPLRILSCVAIVLSVFSVGFVFWYWLFALLFGGAAIVGALLAGSLFTLGALRKKKSEVAGSIAACALLAGFAFGGWVSRTVLREDAMLAESLRLVQRAKEFKMQTGRFATSAKTLAPKDSQERLIAWIAGSSVRYGGYADQFCITRGDGIAGYVYWSNRGTWDFSKL